MTIYLQLIMDSINIAINYETHLVNITENCSDCRMILTHSVRLRVSYYCQARTIKEDFKTVLLDEYKFKSNSELFSIIFYLFTC